jgi:hypothetical protein
MRTPTGGGFIGLAVAWLAAALPASCGGGGGEAAPAPVPPAPCTTTGFVPFGYVGGYVDEVKIHKTAL